MRISRSTLAVTAALSLCLQAPHLAQAQVLRQAAAVDASSMEANQNAAIAHLREDVAALTAALQASQQEITTLKAQAAELNNFHLATLPRLVALESMSQQYFPHRHWIDLNTLNPASFPATARPVNMNGKYFVTIDATADPSSFFRIGPPINSPQE